ncbi:MAG: calcium/proton exchanger [cyanobacterium endosymbiont of Rhopalodia musculus]|uniref:calcium/proton exchanger n=1 Tax=cyanobacterium endosymbiont of Epithemia clementina EcSB TaxID=3034674 RepID=UPI0024803F11|nr:calcium/proton exchanger [cyanobacterium endosymbiont of Epithemia clementina EcSB]WGT66851.1 calcium/proton exchanger [cyanobacterium endosymbiont of Epithemia clementina EcSB]
MITKKNLLFLLLLFIPFSFAANYFHWGSKVVFITAALAIVPLAAFMGEVTEAIAVVTGPNLGGLLNATFGNATELILALIALKEGLISVVKATITGSIIGNLLLVVGFAMLFGGLRYKEQEFQPVAARLNASSMNLAIVAILLPTAVQYTSTGIEEQTLQNLSVAVAIVLIIVYILTLIFSMKTHVYLYNVGMLEMEDRDLSKSSDKDFKKVNVGRWWFLLLLITLGVAIESELLVNSLEEATESLGLTPLFTGVILLPIVGNAAEHATAVTVAIRNKMDLSMAVAVGSSLQIALFVAPVLVISGWISGQPMDLGFNPFELVAVAVAVLITNSISSDGRSNWLEGTLLLATYIVIGLAFYFYPVIDGF